MGFALKFGIHFCTTPTNHFFFFLVFCPKFVFLTVFWLLGTVNTETIIRFKIEFILKRKGHILNFLVSGQDRTAH